MDTPYTIRAQELRDIYNSINMKYLTQDERLDVLLTLKHTVKEHDCKLTQEIIELIDREADLLMRGVKESNLDGLRKRISTLFLQYIKTPTFNPEAARLLKVKMQGLRRIPTMLLWFLVMFHIVLSGSSRSLCTAQRYLLLQKLQPVQALYRVPAHVEFAQCWIMQKVHQNRQHCTHKEGLQSLQV